MELTWFHTNVNARERSTELCLSCRYSRKCLANEFAKRFCLTGWHLVHCVLRCCAVFFLPLTELLCCTEPYLLISARLRLPGLHIKMALCLTPFSQVLCASDLSFQGHVAPLFVVSSLCVRVSAEEWRPRFPVSIMCPNLLIFCTNQPLNYVNCVIAYKHKTAKQSRDSKSVLLGM